MTTQEPILLYCKAKSELVEIKKTRLKFKSISSFTKLHLHFKTTKPIKNILIVTVNGLNPAELLVLKQLKIEYPFVNIFLFTKSKLSFKEYITFIESEITLFKNVTELILKFQVFKVRQSGPVFRRKELELLSFLKLNEGSLISKESILAAVWGYNDEVNSRTLDSHISSLRTKLQKTDGPCSQIKTIHGKGYIFEDRKLSLACL